MRASMRYFICVLCPVIIQISILYSQGAIEPGQQTHVRTPCAYSQDTVTANYQLIDAIQRAPLGRAFIIPRSILRWCCCEGSISTSWTWVRQQDNEYSAESCWWVNTHTFIDLLLSVHCYPSANNVTRCGFYRAFSCLGLHMVFKWIYLQVGPSGYYSWSARIHGNNPLT